MASFMVHFLLGMVDWFCPFRRAFPSTRVAWPYDKRICIRGYVGANWFALVGGTAIDLELSGIAKGAILNADISAQLYETINLLLSPVLAILMSFVIVVLLMTYLITSADSAILIINTISSAGDAEQKHSKHIILWGLILMSVIAVLLIAGGMGALRSVMIIGALPFSLVMALMAMALLKSLLFDSKTKP